MTAHKRSVGFVRTPSTPKLQALLDKAIDFYDANLSITRFHQRVNTHSNDDDDVDDNDNDKVNYEENNDWNEVVKFNNDNDDDDGKRIRTTSITCSDDDDDNQCHQDQQQSFLDLIRFVEESLNVGGVTTELTTTTMTVRVEEEIEEGIVTVEDEQNDDLLFYSNNNYQNVYDSFWCFVDEITTSTDFKQRNNNPNYNNNNVHKYNIVLQMQSGTYHGTIKPIEGT